MSDVSAWGTAIAGIIVSLTGFIALFIRQRDTEKAITNSHPKHIRDDLDDKHEVIRIQLAEIAKNVDRIQEREMHVLERIESISDLAAKEHRSLWKVINNLRNKN